MRKILSLLLMFGLWQNAYADGNNETVIITYAPAVPSQPVQQGACWEQSQAAPRFGAWRCYVNKDVYDPCFSNSDANDAVVCGADPATNSAGFRVSLVKPLPFEQGLPPLPNQAWKVKLTDGTICTALTGSLLIIDNYGTVKYGCSDSAPKGLQSGLLQDLKTGQIWYAHKVIYGSDNGVLFAKSLTQVPIQTVWQ